ncbi:ferredoxin reductase [Spongisporangium articulatum]|uniref:Ferredoxin reductase n=1 Tax=Spongisporangium articulatum TaxID=3362603 RepID=A0ABW8ANY6_9ACTN
MGAKDAVVSGAVVDRAVERLTRLTRPITTPLRLGDYLALVDPLLNNRQLRGRVVSVVPESPDAVTLVIRPGLGWRFEHLPGQFISIGVAVDGRFHWRSYSLTSPPTRRRRALTITVKAMPEGFLSTHLTSAIEPGTVVRLAAPAGEFVLPDPPPARILLLGAGSGITPLISMLRTMRRRGTLSDVVMVTSFRSEETALFRAELSELARGEPNFRLVEHWSADAGHLTPAAVADAVPDWRGRQVWACGPAALLDECQAFWGRAGLTERLHVERYSDGVDGEAAEGTGGTITFRKSGRSVEVDGATTLLEAGEQAGVDMPFGCRMGICHTCVVPLSAGTVVDIRSGDTADETNRYVQTCISVASGDCELDV